MLSKTSLQQNDVDSCMHYLRLMEEHILKNPAEAALKKRYRVCSIYILLKDKARIEEEVSSFLAHYHSLPNTPNSNVNRWME